jgi:Na+/H+ antiporter NhaD/arsenite permease-like protein
VTTAIVIFALAYSAIAARRLGLLPVTRAAAAWGGAVACVLLGVLTPSQAYASIDGDTIVLVISMMVLAAHLEQAGFFEWGGSLSLRLARTPTRLLTIVVFASGLMSAFLVHDAVCFLMTPVVVGIIRRLRLSPMLFLMALMTSANIGSVMTIVGNPQNMIIGSLSGLGFREFFMTMAPLGIACLLLNRLLLPRFYPLLQRDSAELRERAEWLDTAFDDADEVPHDFRHTLATNLRSSLLIKCIISLGLAQIGFFLGLNVAWTALAAAGVLLILAPRQREAFRHVDWQLLLFLAGLFVIIGALRSVGANQRLFDWLQPWFGNAAEAQGWRLALTVFLGCNLFSEIPFVLVAADWMKHFADPRSAWLLLAMASTFAGNSFLISSLANVVVVERGRTRIGFGSHLRYGLVISVLTTLLGSLWILFVT